MNRSNKILAVAAAAEAATGLALMLVPSLVCELLLGAQVAGTGIAAARVAGFALIGLGLACWPRGERRALWGMLAYSSLTALYLVCLGVDGRMVGPLLWPAAAAHFILSVVLTWNGVVRRKLPDA